MESLDWRKTLGTISDVPFLQILIFNTQRQDRT